jgi:tetratricopeptide (TPR) repeat protein
MKWISIFIWLFFWAAMLFSQPAQTPNDVFKSGIAAYQQNDYDLSYKLLSQAIGMDPNRNYFYYNRGLTAKAMGNNAQAAADFRKSLDLKTTAEAYYQLGLLAYQHKDMAEAKLEFENARALREDMADMNFFLGLIYVKDKQFDEGYRCFQACTDNNKNNAEAYYYRGYCAAEMGMHDQAIQSLKFATVYNGKDYRYYMKMFEVYKALNDNQNALNNISMVIELGERKPDYLLKRAELYKLTGQDFLAEEDTKAASQLSESAAVEEDK